MYHYKRYSRQLPDNASSSVNISKKVIITSAVKNNTSGENFSNAMHRKRMTVKLPTTACCAVDVRSSSEERSNDFLRAVRRSQSSYHYRLDPVFSMSRTSRK